MKCHQAVIDRAAQGRFEQIPICRSIQRKPIGSALQNRLGTVTLGVGDVIDEAEFNRCQMVGVFWVGKPVDSRVPTRSEHGDTKVIERCATTDDRFSTRIVCPRNCSVTIDEQMQDPAHGHPQPRLAVVHGWSPASQ